MEADIVAEGFRQAESMHVIRYMKVVGDGDSSVRSTIQDTVSWGPYVTKIECANHAVKSYHSRLEKITEDYPLYKRKLTKKIIKRLTIGARCAIKMHASTGNYKQLQEDFRNGPYHVDNHHERCNTTFCKAAQKKHQCPTSSSDACLRYHWQLIFPAFHLECYCYCQLTFSATHIKCHHRLIISAVHFEYHHQLVFPAVNISHWNLKHY